MEPTTTTVRRRPSPRNLAERERTEEMKELAAATAREVLQASESGDFDEEEDIESNSEFEDKLEEEVNKSNETNPFILAETMAKKGVGFEFRISKNGANISIVQDEELNEDYLRNKWGGGNYTVHLSRTNPKKFVKQQTFKIAEAARLDITKEDSKPDVSALLIKSIEERQKSLEASFRDKEERLERERLRERQEYKDRLDQEREERKLEMERRSIENNTGKSSIIETIAALKSIIPEPREPKDNSTEMMKMMMEMQKNTTEMMKEMGNNTREMMKEMNDKTEKMFDKLANKKEGLTDMQIQDKLDNARREARQDFKERQEEIKEAAEERALILAGREPSEEKEESLLDGVLKQLPALIMASKRSVEAAPAPDPQRRIAPPQAQQRASAPQRRPTQTTVNPMGVKPQPINRPMQSSFQNNGQASSDNLNKIPVPVTINKDQEKEQIGLTLSDILVDGINNKKEARSVGLECFNVLDRKKLFSKRVFEYYPLKDLKELRDMFSLEASDAWIEGFYDVLKEKSSYNGKHEEATFS